MYASDLAPGFPDRRMDLWLGVLELRDKDSGEQKYTWLMFASCSEKSMLDQDFASMYSFMNEFAVSATSGTTFAKLRKFAREMDTSRHVTLVVTVAWRGISARTDTSPK